MKKKRGIVCHILQEFIIVQHKGGDCIGAQGMLFEFAIMEEIRIIQLSTKHSVI